MHRIERLAQRSGAQTTIIETAKFDTQKILDPQIEGTGYQRGPLYRRHLREYIARVAPPLHLLKRRLGGRIQPGRHAGGEPTSAISLPPCNERKGERQVTNSCERTRNGSLRL